ncbi:Semaphorin-4D [Acipenser ruthenus]|uniref:Semaphorin-4D n=1 Tax=Acipenser ruthenus TaxID=7906 RepID=A0A444V1C6_ACIRT|nr:Semaphorin-4D [Acipenser ruthenus]
MKNISVKTNETECLNYIRVLQVLNDASLYVCGTYAFQPTCDYLSLQDFELENKNEDGRGRCSFDPAQSFTSVMVDGDLYSGTAFNFLGSEPIIHRSSPQVSLRTEYSISWLNEPSFVFADVIRESKNSPDGDDDKIYFFFTEVSVEYEFVGKLSIPRIARVCKGDLGGQRTLQKKWTSFLKAKLVCSMPELNFVFNVVHDVFILKTPDWKETVIYGVFTSQWGNIGLSAVCAYNMSTIDEVFSKGKYMQKASVEQSHTKWVRFNAMPPSPRPGACINNIDRLQNISDSLRLPDKTLQFIKDHPLMDDQVLPIGNGPKLIRRDVNYTQIVVDRVRALDNNVYDVIFTSTVKYVSSDDYQKIIVKPGNAAELQCQLKSNLAKVVWKLNGTILSVEDSKYHLLRGDSLLILSISEQDLGNYECWSEEQVKSSSFAQLVAGFVLSLDLIVPSTTSDPTTTATTTTTPLNPVIQTEGNANTAESTLTSTPPGSTTPTTLPPQTKLTPTSSTTIQTLRKLPIPISDAPNLETKDPSTEYIKSNNNNALLLLFLLFFILFLALMAYNCYMQFLPPPCLKLRAALLGSNKKAKPEYMACEAGLMEPIVEKTAQIEAHNQNGGQQKGLRDTGYETEPDCSNGKIPTTKHLEEPPESKDKPFDVICESQPIEYADADAPC